LPPHQTSVVIAILVTLYFWRKNIIGIEESSDKALKIMIGTGVMVVILIIWSLLTLSIKGGELPPFQPQLTDEALGWLKNASWIKQVGFFAILIGFGHSILAMSGEESLAQVYRDIESPKLKNLIRAGRVISVFSIAFTGLATLFAVMIIPDSVRLAQYGENLIVGLAANFVGPEPLKLFFKGFVVVMGAFILGGAVNTAIVGLNGSLNRVAEDGILPRWFKGLHIKYGTTHRIINLVVIIQITTIILSRGDVFLLGEAYAFGVIWSFVFTALSVTVLRFKDPSQREWRVPGNIKFGSKEIPLGLIFITTVLFMVALTNFFTKTIATKAGLAFTLSLFLLFYLAEHFHHKNKGGAKNAEQFNLQYKDSLSLDTLRLKHPRRLLIGVRDPHNLVHMIRVLEKLKGEADILILSSRRRRAFETEEKEDLGEEEQELLSNVVSVAERFGQDVIPIIVPTNDPVYSIAKTGMDTRATEIIVGSSNKLSPEIQLEQLAMAWGAVHAKEPRPVKIRIISDKQELSCDLT